MASGIRFGLNGRHVALDVDRDRTLLSILRTDLELTGAKYGCGQGLCGACTVLVDGKATRACSTPLHAVAGKEVVTIEGLASGERLHPLQQAFIDHGAFQCGYCTPGMLLSAHALLRETPKPSRAAIVAYLERNLCRCGAHQRIGWVCVNVSPAAVGLGLFAPRQSGAGMLAQTCADWAGHPEDTAASKQRLRSCCVVADKTASAHTGARHETQG